MPPSAAAAAPRSRRSRPAMALATTQAMQAALAGEWEVATHSHAFLREVRRGGRAQRQRPRAAHASNARCRLLLVIIASRPSPQPV